ncbi:MAG: hypothetical protein A2X31_02720 [Elusimicrobia bacterium GWB2_63_22]|nr:MAG: hypothetical protein A2X31_02720 [Elusimicrobia bacterium GWB2_63_22]
MELKPLKMIGTYSQYRLKKFSELNNNLLAELHKNWPRGATHAVFQFGEPIKNEWRVTKPLLPKYNVALIYTAKPSAIKAKKVALPETLVRGELSTAKVGALYKRVLLDTHKKIKKLGPAFKAEIATALAALKKSSHESLFKAGRPVTLFAKYRRKNYIGKQCDWMLTGWGEATLSKRESVAVEDDFWSFVKRSKLPVDYKTRSFRRQGQQEARERGFKPHYVTVAKMP